MGSARLLWACLLLSLSSAVLVLAADPEWRAIDGSNNNAANPTWGGPNMGNGSVPNCYGVSDFLWAWGQIVDHDITLIPDNVKDEPNSLITGNGNVVIPVTRTAYMKGSKPRCPMNVNSAWLDGSMLYGSTADRAKWLRSGVGGGMKTTAGNMLPLNDGTVANKGGPNITDLSPRLYVGGDIRVNEHAVLHAMHTLLVREHNYQASEVAKANPKYTDEQIYQLRSDRQPADAQHLLVGDLPPPHIHQRHDPVARRRRQPHLRESVSSALDLLRPNLRPTRRHRPHPARPRRTSVPGLGCQGDRFWYERIFDKSTVAQINQVKLSDIILRNTDISSLQRDVFTASRVGATPLPCDCGRHCIASKCSGCACACACQKACIAKNAA
eukprot:jgi/Chlat1/5557/Chrsp369S05352